MKKQQSGFTLIELVMVIVILGILSAVAIPKFIDLSLEAKTSAAKGLAAGLSSAFAINYAGAVVAVTGSNAVAGSSAFTAFANAVMTNFSMPTGFSLATASSGGAGGGTAFNCTAAGQSTTFFATDGTSTGSATLICTG